MFRELTHYRDDPIEAMFVRLAADNSPDRMDLGIGVFRDDAGRVPVFEAVREAESRVVSKEETKSYIGPLGNQDYCRAVERLILGAEHPVLGKGNVISAQTPGAGGALRVGAELVRTLSRESRVWVSVPVWPHQLEYFEKPGMAVMPYRYYDQFGSVLQFGEMLEDLKGMRRNDLLLLHGCCHNPTGQDLDMDQWQAVTDLVMQKGTIPFVDIAYQGFGRGIGEDVAGVRLMASQVPQMVLAVSSSKSFGIYRERAGMLSVLVSSGSTDAAGLRRRVRDMARQLYFMPPDHGAAIVLEILSSPDLEDLWRSELEAMRLEVIDKRQVLRNMLEAEVGGFDASFIEAQLGMFSCLPIDSHEQRLMEDLFHIYMMPDARVNVAAMRTSDAQVLARSFRELIGRRRGDGIRAPGGTVGQAAGTALGGTAG